MDKPVWILLPHLSDWRWMQETETTPWYPSARLFRQTGSGDWLGVLERVIAAIEASFAAANPPKFVASLVRRLLFLPDSKEVH